MHRCKSILVSFRFEYGFLLKLSGNKICTLPLHVFMISYITNMDNICCAPLLANLLLVNRAIDLVVEAGKSTTSWATEEMTSKATNFTTKNKRLYFFSEFYVCL